MKPRQQVTRAAVELIKRFEGFRATAAQLDDGRWTIGYGHTASARAGAVVSEPDAEALLLYDLITVAHVVNEQVFTPLTAHQFDALCCFAFNIGTEAFRRSAVLKRINEGQLLQAALEMELWRKADFDGERIVIDGLVRRRAAEKALFLTPLDGWIPVPSPVLPPRLDLDGTGLVPVQTPRIVPTRLDGDQPLPAQTTPPPPPTATETVAAEVGARLERLVAEEPEAQPTLSADPADLEPISTPLTVVERPPLVESELLPELDFGLEPEPKAAHEPAPPPPAPPIPVMIAVEAPPASTLKAPEPPVSRPEPPAATAAFAPWPTMSPPAEPSQRPFTLDPEIERIASMPSDLPAPQQPSLMTGVIPLVALAIVGLALLGGGITWGLGVQGSNGALLAVTAGGLLVSIVGVLCFGVAAYLLLALLGGPQAEPDDEA